MLPDPVAAASRLKQALQSVFETQYSFDLEFLKKENIGKAVKTLERYKGVTPFVVSYVTQNALGGHSIAIDKGTRDTFVVLGVATEAEAEKNHVPGVERAISKSKGVEFTSLLHQLAADYYASPFSPRVRSVILEIAPDAQDRLPKRPAKKKQTKKTATASKAPAKKKKAVSAAASSGVKKKSATKRLARRKPR